MLDLLQILGIIKLIGPKSIWRFIMQKKQTAIFLAPLFIVAGIVITLENYQIISGVSNHWPLFLLVLGVGFIMLFFQRFKTDSVLLWLGTFISALGLFFYYLNFTNWQSLSRLWPFFLGIVGASFLAVSVGTRTILCAYFSAAFLTLFAILTLVFSVSTRLWPLSFVVFGISLLVLEYLHRRMKVKE